MSENKLINSVKKALDALDILAFEDYKGRGMSLKELSDKLGIKQSTLFGILKTMIYCGYVQKKDGSLYTIGKRCRQIGIMNRLQFSPKISNTINNIVMRLCRKTDEGVSFYVLDNGERINYINYQSRAVVRVEYTMLRENSIYAYPSGRQLVAFCDDSELDLIIRKHGYPGEHWNGASDRASLMKEIEKVRAKRILKQDTEGGTVTSYAVAVFEKDTLLGSLGIYMPAFRATEEKELLITRELLSAAGEIEKILG